MEDQKDLNALGQNDKKHTITPAEALAKMDELLGRKDEINERIRVIQLDFSAIAMKRSSLQRSIMGLKNRLLGIPENEKIYFAARQKLKDEILSQQQSMVQIDSDDKSLHEEMKQLQTVDLPECMVSICAKDVMEHKRQVIQASATVDNIQAAIDSKNMFLEQTRASVPKLSSRQDERHNLLADIALGNACEADIKKLDTTIAKEQKAVADAEKEITPLIENALSTVSGLHVKLDAAKKALSALESKSSEVKYRFFMGEAEKVGACYANAAIQLKELYFRLRGLDAILKEHDKVGLIDLSTSKSIQVPLFQFSGLSSTGESALIDGDNIRSDHVNELVKNEHSRLEDLLMSFSG